LFAPLLFIGAEVKAVDRGQYADMPEDIRAWFKSVRSPRGVPCCDISDGHRTDYDMRHDAYWVPIDGTWMQVPHEAVVPHATNPTGSGVVWYTKYGVRIVIRCFVPNGDV
jgi:hypothetical protein